MEDLEKLLLKNPDLDRLTVKFVIEHIAETGSPITYGDLAKCIDKVKGGKFNPQGFGAALGRIQAYCAELDLPALSAMVVNQSFKPGDGFEPIYLELHPEDRGKPIRDIFIKEQNRVRACKDWQRLYDLVGIKESVPIFRDRLAENKAEKPIAEGARVAKDISVETSRSPEARRRCLAEKGYRCFVCEKTSEEVYGVSGIIHVHHLKPLAESVGLHTVDVSRDLIPVCPTCHAVIHSGGDPCYTPNEVRQMIGFPPLDGYETLLERG